MVTTNNIPAMFASHIISQPKADDEFHVILIGDSATWGWLLEKAGFSRSRAEAQRRRDGEGAEGRGIGC